MEPIEQVNFISRKIKEIPTLNPPFEYTDNLIVDFSRRVDDFYKLMKDLSKNKNLTILDGMSNSLRSIDVLKKGIISSIEYHLSGRLNDSYKKFEHALSYTRINEHIHKTALPLNKIITNGTSYYRVRVSNTPLTHRRDLFHIPFNLRHLVKTQRFSISGLPCLYLGSSILTCWHEMGKPDFDKLYISAFTIDKQLADMKIIHLAFNLTSALSFSLSDHFDQRDLQFKLAKDKISNLIIWPLVLACHYKKKFNSNFNIEYIIPNLLMEWVYSTKAKGIAGIAYQTTKFINPTNKKIEWNLILPPKLNKIIDSQASFCPTLVNTFKVTNPISWQAFKTLHIHSMASQDKQTLRSTPNGGNIDNFDEYLIENYDKTEFSSSEEIIKNLMKFNYLDQE